MTSISVAVLSAAEFDVARGLISDLSAHLSYDDWLDCRYGTFMGRSLGGDDAHLVTVSLEPFLEWCVDQGVRPSESALDAFALGSGRGEDTNQAVESSAPTLRRPVLSTVRKPRLASGSHGPKSASRSVTVDL